jgi:hypothetical protein
MERTRPPAIGPAASSDHQPLYQTRQNPHSWKAIWGREENFGRFVQVLLTFVGSIRGRYGSNLGASHTTFGLIFMVKNTTHRQTNCVIVSSLFATRVLPLCVCAPSQKSTRRSSMPSTWFVQWRSIPCRLVMRCWSISGRERIN